MPTICTTILARWRKLRCRLGLHEWDGYIELNDQCHHTYPAPQCKFCSKWHHRDLFNEAG